MGAEKSPIANLFDVDDTMVLRHKIARWWQAWRVGKFGPKELESLLERYKSISDIPNYIQSAPDTEHIGPIESASLLFHASRAVIPGIIGLAKYYHRDGIPNYIATGRRHHKEWINATKKTLTKGGIDKNVFTEMFFKRKGAESALSKAIVIKMLLHKYENIRFFEDDVETAIFISKIFGNAVEIHLIFHEQNARLYEKLSIKDYHNIQLHRWKSAKIF